MKYRLYLLGPMRSYPQFNFPAFDAARDDLRAYGHEVVSPADLDRASGFDPSELPDDWDWKTLPPGFELQDCIRRDVNAILDCNAYAALPGWEHSTGAKAEKSLLDWKQAVRIDPETGQPWVQRTGTVLDEAARLTAQDRNLDYGHPQQDFSKTAAIWNGYLQGRLAPGKELTAMDVPMLMIGVKLARLAHKYKSDSVIDIAGYARTAEMVAEYKA